MVDSFLHQISDLNKSLSELLAMINDSAEQQYENESRQSQQDNQYHTETDVTSYFNGCETLQSLKTRYRDLCKVYHPDMGNGSPEEFDKIQKEYNVLKEKLK
jgi:hypothetical protein